MDLVEKLNQKFGSWYESLFGENGDAELRPKDVLRKILHAMDDNRSEGIDGNVYVPNRYILVLNLVDTEERDYLLSFLDEEELAEVLNRYMAQNGYAVRGPLDFTITDAKLDTGNRQPKLTVKARFEKGPTEPVPPAPDVVAERAAARGDSEDLPTVASLFDDDLATVSDLPYAWATVALTEPDGHRSLVTLTAPTFTVGRSRSVGNDLVLTADGKVSKRHARIERNAAGRPLIYDLASTNGTTVNDVRIFDSSILQSSDKIGIGDTILVFEMIADPAAPGGSSRSARKRAVLAPMNGGAERVLASDNLIGRGITCDIVLDDAASANRQARIVSHEGGNYTIEDLSGQKSTLLNERTIHPAERLKLSHGDRVQFGITLFQFLEKNP